MDTSYEKLEKTYELIGKYIPERNIDCLEVVKQVETYRQSWKPKKTTVILLAESHVYTERQELNAKCNVQVVNGFIKLSSPLCQVCLLLRLRRKPVAECPNQEQQRNASILEDLQFVCGRKRA